MKALILADIQYDFLPGGALGIPHGDEVIAPANALMPSFAIVVATQDWHPADHVSFASRHPGRRVGDVIDLSGTPQILWPDHCVQGTHGAELSAELHREGITKIFHKATDPMIDSYSAFFDNDHRHSTGLGQWLRQQKVDEVFVGGLATDYCVRATVLDAINLGLKTHVVLSACRGVELHAGDCQRAIDEMRLSGAEILP